MPTFRNAAAYSANLDDGTPVGAVRVVSGAGLDVFPADPFTAGAAWIDPLNGSGLNVDGSGTPVVRTIQPGEGQVVTVYGLALIIEDGSVGALDDLGAVTGVSDGIEVVWSGGAPPMSKIRTNASLLLVEGGPVKPEAFGAQFVWVYRKTLDAPIVLTDADSLSVTITDDLSGLTSATLYVAMVQS